MSALVSRYFQKWSYPGNRFYSLYSMFGFSMSNTCRQACRQGKLSKFLEGFGKYATKFSIAVL